MVTAVKAAGLRRPLRSRSENSAATAFGRAGMVLVVTASLFNLVLCFIETRNWANAGNTGVIAIELLILACGLFIIRHHVTPLAAKSAGLVLAYLLAAKLINPGLDLKIFHDIAIMYIFFTLGSVASIEAGNRLVWFVMMIVLAVGMFEFLFPTQFGSVFDVWSYYVNKGIIGQDVTNYSQTTLFISGNRGSSAGRTFLPSLLGTHRVSSIFLEPVSMGNFATIVFAWCLSVRGEKQWSRLPLVFLAAVCIVLGDSRFGSICCVLMLIVRFVPVIHSKFIIFLMPVFAMLALMLAGQFHEIPGVLPAIQEDNFPGRLLFSGRLLDYWHPAQWLGFAASPIYTSDTGYAYLVNNLGLPLTLLLLAMFASYTPKNKEALMMKTLITVYFATSLGVGSSIFSIKTAALLWFLYGTTDAIRRRNIVKQPRELSPTSITSLFPSAGAGRLR
jgi:putative polymerase